MGMGEMPKSRNKTSVRIYSGHLTESDFEKNLIQTLILCNICSQKLEKTAQSFPVSI